MRRSLRAADYVLGLLSPDERLAFSHEMNSDPAVRAEATFWTEHFAEFAMGVTAVDPPQGSFDAISEAVFGPEPPAATAAQWTRRLAGGVLIAACGWTLGAPFFARENPRSNDLLAVLRTDDGRVVANAAFDPDTARIYVQRALAAVAQDQIYEVWLIADGSEPVSLGVLPDTEQMRFKVAKGQRGLMARSVLAVSQERADAPAHNAPTGPVIAIAALSAR